MNALLDRRREDVVRLCRRHGVARLEVFGSATDDSFDPEHSDLDFLVTFAPCAPGEHYERYFGLVESLESLFGRPVDLVEASAMRNPYFVRSVNETKALLYVS